VRRRVSPWCVPDKWRYVESKFPGAYEAWTRWPSVELTRGDVLGTTGKPTMAVCSVRFLVVPGGYRHYRYDDRAKRWVDR